MNYPVGRLGDFVAFSNGRSSPGRMDAGKFKVFGSNGPIGKTAEQNAPPLTTVIGRVGTYCGSVHFSQEASWVTDNAIKAVANKEDEGRFWYYALLLADLGRLRSGSGQPLINQRSLNAVELPVPPRSDRLMIAGILGSIDDKIELNRQTNETLEAMAQAIFRDWFVEFGPTRRRIEGASDPVEIMGGLITEVEWAQKLADLIPSKFGANGLPEGWRTGELGDLVSNVVERCKPSGETQALPYVPIDTIDARKLVLSQWRPGEEAQSSLVRFKSNDILFGAMRPYFHKVAVSAFDGVTRTTVFVLRPKLQADLYFAASQINEPSSIEYATLHSSGSTIPYAVWPNSFEKLPVALPPPDVRCKYGELVALYFSLMNLNEGQNRSLSSTRDLLLPKLMSGKIRLREAEAQLEAAQ